MQVYPTQGMGPGVTQGLPLHNSAYMNQPVPQAPQTPVMTSSPGLLQPPVSVNPSGSPRPNSTGRFSYYSRFHLFAYLFIAYSR